MPANRSRTERWKDSLWKIYERGGGLEFAFAHADAPHHDDAPKDLILRVRILGLSDEEIHVELPGALGRPFRIDPGAPLVGIMAVGQNRWMFHTEVLGALTLHGRQGETPALRLRMPDTVERCQRRTFDRISTASLTLPPVECWPLLDIRTAPPAEIASRVRLLDMLDADLTGPSMTDNESLMPDVGARMDARLSNIGGGGIGLVVDREVAAPLESGRLFWLRVDLAPVLPAPLSLVGRLAHTHIDSQQRVYAGLAFEFAHNTPHQRFVLDQIDRYLTAIQTRRAA